MQNCHNSIKQIVPFSYDILSFIMNVSTHQHNAKVINFQSFSLR